MLRGRRGLTAIRKRYRGLAAYLCNTSYVLHAKSYKCFTGNKRKNEMKNELTPPALTQRLRNCAKIAAPKSAVLEGTLLEASAALDAKAAEIAQLQGLLAAQDKALAALETENEMLKAKLEVDPDVEYDGIDCRDATIKLQDAEIAALRKDALQASATAFSFMVMDRPNELPEDAQELAKWLDAHVFPSFPPDPAGPEELFLYIIRKAIAQVPEGYKLAPLEPTTAMRLAAQNAESGVPSWQAHEIYRAMLAAAPDHSE